jgi:hypothetical protein
MEMDMRILIPNLFAACVVAVLYAPSVSASEGGNGGDREPAGGAFMTSYPEQGSTGIQQGGPPRSVDIPRYYSGPEITGPARGARWRRASQRD